MRRGVRLGVDVGDARIGVARATPPGSWRRRWRRSAGPGRPGADRRAARGELDGEYEPIEVVVGLPRSLSGGEGPAAAKVRAFAGQLARAVAPVPVRLVDERMTTVTRGGYAARPGPLGGQSAARWSTRPPPW